MRSRLGAGAVSAVLLAAGCQSIGEQSAQPDAEVVATATVSEPVSVEPGPTASAVPPTPVFEPEPAPTSDPRLDLVDSLEASEAERAIVRSLLDETDTSTPEELLEAVRVECAAIAHGRPPADALVRRLVEAEPDACPEPVPTPTSPQVTATAASTSTSAAASPAPPTAVPPTPAPAATPARVVQPTPVPTAATAPSPAPTAIPVPPAPAPTATPIPPPPTFYANCDAARDAGVAPIPIGQPGYRPGLDRDNDGLACDEEASTPSTPAQERQCQGVEIKIDGSCYLLAGAPQFDLDTGRSECENGARLIEANCYLYVGPAR